MLDLGLFESLDLFLQVHVKLLPSVFVPGEHHGFEVLLYRLREKPQPLVLAPAFLIIGVEVSIQLQQKLLLEDPHYYFQGSSVLKGNQAQIVYAHFLLGFYQ